MLADWGERGVVELPLIGSQYAKVALLTTLGSRYPSDSRATASGDRMTWGGPATAPAYLRDYLMASALTGDPTAPVMGRGEATKKNS